MAKSTSRTNVPRKPQMHVAVVMVTTRESHRGSGGDWASFVGPDKDDVVGKALAARARWGPQTYDVLVGTLDTKVETPINFKLVPLV